MNHEHNLEKWLTSVDSILDNVTTLKVDTIIVEEITEESYLPWEIYQDIYDISRTNLEEAEISGELCDHYLNLRRQLELKYALRAINPNCAFYNPSEKDSIIKNLPILKSSTDRNWEKLPSLLPSPFVSEKTKEDQLLSKVLTDKPLLRLLHQLGRNKANLDRNNTTPITNRDITYAQTVIHLDSQITNSYAQEILHHPDKETILLLHQQGVEYAQKQWYKLLKFAINIVQKQQKVRKS